MLVCPLADGGEGTTDALTDGMDGEKISLTVTGPLGEKQIAIMDGLTGAKGSYGDGFGSRNYTCA